MNCPTTLRAKAITSGRCEPTLPELSRTSVRSTWLSHGGGADGGAGGSGGDFGGNATIVPHICTASICSKPEARVLILMLSPMAPSMYRMSNEEPHDVVSVPCHMVVEAPLSYEFRTSTFVTNGAR